MRQLTVLSCALLACAAACALGCAGGTRSGLIQPDPIQLDSIHGTVFDGQQPVAGATVQLWAVGAAGPGSASTPLLSPAASSGQGGGFNLGAYTCPASDPQVYLTATGGNPGLGNGTSNAQLALMVALGPCSSLTATTRIAVNEITTVAAAAALAPYAHSISAIGVSPASSAQINQAFAYARQLANPQTGATPGINVPANASVPVEEIDTLADLIATCVDSSGGTAGDGSACGTLFSLTTPHEGVVPADTVQALLNLERFPTLNTADLYRRAPASAPFQPRLADTPPNFAVVLTYSNTFSVYPGSLAFLGSTVGFSQPSETLTVNNGTTQSVSLSGFGFTGSAAADYLVDDTTCSTTLAAGSSCTYSVVWVPGAVGERDASFFVANSSASANLTIPVTGTAVAAPAAQGSALSYGYTAYGDSNTAGAGYQPSYPTLIFQTYFPQSAPFANYAVPGYTCIDQSARIFSTIAPADSGNPIVTDMIGTNDTSNDYGSTGAVYFLACQLAGNARIALSSSSVIAAGSAAVTASGIWTADQTYPLMSSLQSTTAGSCISTTTNVPAGVFYLWHLARFTSGGLFQVTSDGQALTDTVSSSAVLASKIGTYTQPFDTLYPALARFTVTPGSHTLAVCTTSVTSSSNDVHLLGFGLPPAAPYTAPGAPSVYIGGVMHVQNDPTDQKLAGLGVANTLNQQVVQILTGDHLAARFVDVRSFVDPVLGMQSSTDGNCHATNNPGYHVNDCGTFELESAFWESMNGSSAPGALVSRKDGATH